MWGEKAASCALLEAVVTYAPLPACLSLALVGELLQELWLSAPQQNGASSSSSLSSAAVAVAAGAAEHDPLSSPALRNMTMLYLKANFEYLRQNYHKALKVLSSSQHDAAVLAGDAGGPPPAPAPAARPLREGLVGALYLNNVGCVHHKMRRYGAALLFFEKALKQLEDQRGQAGLQKDGRVLPGFECEVHYNTGVQLLQTGARKLLPNAGRMCA